MFPVEPGGKRPAVDQWEGRACSDPEVVYRAWLERWAGHNIGLAPGPAGLAVLDLDCHTALPDEWRAIPGVRDGSDVFACLLEWAGETSWPATTWVRTPSGGSHLYFRQPPGQKVRNSAGLIGPGIDVRGHGGYAVAPGSRIGGRAYGLLDGTGPAPMPAWLARRLAPKPPPRAAGRPAVSAGGEGWLGAVLQMVRDGQPGDRNGRLFWAACRVGEHVAAGQADPGELEAALVRAALDAGLAGGEAEAARTVASGLRRGGGR